MLLLFPRATSQTDALARTFDDCREGQEDIDLLLGADKIKEKRTKYHIKEKRKRL